MVRELRPWSAHVTLRDWQRELLCQLSAERTDKALIVATPGSGKTLCALRFAHDLLGRGVVERLVVVVPSEHLKWQWHDAAKCVGIELDPNWANEDGVEASDYDGVIVTYAQVASQPELFRLNTKRSTLLVGDEWHHAADDLRWGRALRTAFEFARFRLLLSGTAFRTDNSQIPWVEYRDGRSRADFEYGYARALADGVCRPIHFPSTDGQVRWQSRDGQCEESWLSKPIKAIKEGERLRAVLNPSGAWVQAVLRRADEELTRMRVLGHADAAAIAFAQAQEHARRLGEVLTRISGEEAVVAVSDDSESSQKIARFATGTSRWIVAVRLISEGVDLPRLRVGVYATTVCSELYFRQVVGRLVRVIKGLDEQWASLFIPAVEPLIGHALAIQQERDHVLKRGEAGEGVYAATAACRTPAPFIALSSTPVVGDTVYDGSRFSAGELAHAEAMARQMGLSLSVPAVQVAALLRKGAAAAGVHVTYPKLAPVASNEPALVGNRGGADMAKVESLSDLSGLSLHERKAARRLEINRLVNRLAGLIGARPFRIHTDWKEQAGRGQQHATEEELEAKLRWLLARINAEYAKRNRVTKLGDIRRVDVGEKG